MRHHAFTIFFLSFIYLQFSEESFKLMNQRQENEGHNSLDAKEMEHWRPHSYFVELLKTYNQTGSTTIQQHLKILLLTILTYQPPLRTSFYTTALFLREKNNNDKKHKVTPLLSDLRSRERKER